ncbi:MAG: hypothetical protein LBC74_06405 [Planctomycetaceae bacterium]|jgi:hypothetical protein|nr:hypothetical protein [Planctomycetaceae bacterium]
MAMIYLRTIIFILLSGVLLTSFGCTKNGNRGTIPVTVTVKYNGVPVQEAVVVFIAENNYANGLTNKSGFARMSTFQSGDGVIPDNYNVTIYKAEVVEELDPNKPPGMNVISSKTIFHIPEKYGEISTSGLVVYVTENDSNNYVFELVD